MRVYRARILSTAALAGFALVAPARAQTSGVAAPAAAPEARGAAADDIVVTARRREESIQKVPVAITAFSEKSLQQKSIYNAFDLNKAVPGLATAADGGAGNIPIFSIRGRGQFYGAATGSVETYFADMPLSSPYETPTLPAQFFDLQSVQVLKGPQGTLFGRNSTGGAVLLVPQAPTDTFGGYMRVQGGNYDDLQVEAALNLPFSDKVMLRVAGFEWHRKGYTRVLAGTDEYDRAFPATRIDNQDITEARATLLLKPSDRLTNSTIFTYHTDKNRGSPQLAFLKGADGSPIALTGAQASPRVMTSSTNLRRPPSSTYAFVNTTTYDLTDDLTIKNIFGHIHAEGLMDNPTDTDGSAIVAVDVPRPPRQLQNYQTTEELQLQGHAFGGKLDFIGGGLIDLTRQPGGNDDINIFTLSYPASSAAVPLGFDEAFRQSHYTSKSAFGSLTFHVNDRLTLTGGVRRTYDYIRERRLEYIANPPDVIANPSSSANGFQTEAAKFAGWSYNGSAEYRPTSATMIYGGYRRGYKRGGFNSRPPSPSQSLFGPETVDDFYVGLKQDLSPLGLRGHFNIEGFYDLYHGAQRSYLTLVSQGGVVALATVTTNAEKETYRGFDMDLVVEASPWLELSGNYTFVDAFYNKYTDPSVTDPAELALLADPSTNLAVNPPGLVSRNKMSATARFHTELADGSEIAFAPTINYQSKFFINDFSKRQPNSAALLFLGGKNIDSAAVGADVVPGYATVDLRVEWNRVRGSNFDIGLNGNNLLNKTFATGGPGIYEFGFEALSYGPPRMVTAEVRYHF